MAVALPMGFSWSLFLCQQIGEYQASMTPELAGARIIRGRGVAPDLSGEGGGRPRVFVYVYVDNIGGDEQVKGPGRQL